jgi:hypothetical protein
VVFTAAGLTLGLTATVPFEHDGRDVTAEFKLAEGESAVFALDEAGSGAAPRACSGAEAQARCTGSKSGAGRSLVWRDVIRRGITADPERSDSRTRVLTNHPRTTVCAVKR